MNRLHEFLLMMSIALILVTARPVPLFAQEAAAEAAANNATDTGTAVESATETAAGAVAGTDTAAAADAEKTEKRRNTIRYGTDNEITALISTLKSEKTADLDGELITVAEKTGNLTILTALFSFFTDREQAGLGPRALTVLENYEDERNDVVLAAIDYLGKTRDTAALPFLMTILDASNDDSLASGQGPFVNVAIRAYGRIAGAGGAGSDADEAAEFLIDYYENRTPSGEAQREIIAALGETGSQKATPFLVEVIGNAENRYVLRMAALDSVSKTGDPAAKEAVIGALTADNPNVRSSAVGALGAFTGADVDQAILDAFRDSFFRTRLGASEAAGRRKLAEAIPYLRYRALNDETPTVRDEAVKALGAMAVDGGEALTSLLELFEGEKNPDRIRALAAEQLIKTDKDAYSGKVRAVMDDAKKKNRTALATGLERALGKQ